MQQRFLLTRGSFLGQTPGAAQAATGTRRPFSTNTPGESFRCCSSSPGLSGLFVFLEEGGGGEVAEDLLLRFSVSYTQSWLFLPPAPKLCALPRALLSHIPSVCASPSANGSALLAAHLSSLCSTRICSASRQLTRARTPQSCFRCHLATSRGSLFLSRAGTSTRLLASWIPHPLPPDPAPARCHQHNAGPRHHGFTFDFLHLAQGGEQAHPTYR